MEFPPLCNRLQADDSSGVHPSQSAEQFILPARLQSTIEPLDIFGRRVPVDDEPERARASAETPADADDRASDVNDCGRRIAPARDNGDVWKESRGRNAAQQA
jgi:hypothetical protein